MNIPRASAFPLPPPWEPRGPILRLDSLGQIAELLKRVATAGGELDIHTKDLRVVRTRLLLVDSNHRNLYIEDPGTQPVFEHGVEWRMSGSLAGGHIELRAQILERLLLNGLEALRAAFPRYVEYYEQRINLRAHVSADTELSPLHLKGVSGSADGSIVDLSAQGAGTLVASDFDAAVGATLDCGLNLPDARITTDAKVRSAEPSVGSQRLGLLFPNLTAREEQSLASVVERLRSKSP